jgi:hypothetical protein
VPAKGACGFEAMVTRDQNEARRLARPENDGLQYALGLHRFCEGVDDPTAEPAHTMGKDRNDS